MRSKRTKRPAVTIIHTSKLIRGLVLTLIGTLLCVAVIAAVIFRLVQTSQLNNLNQVSFGLIEGSSNRIILSTYHKQTNELTFVVVPPNLKLPLIYGYGTYQIGVVPQLGKQEELGNTLLTNSVNQALGLSLEGFAIIDTYRDWEDVPINSVVSQLSLSLQDKLWLRHKLRNANTTELIELVTSSTVSQETRVDGEVEYVLTPSVLRFIQDKLGNRELAKQSLEMAVVNATPHSGLATQVANSLKLAGFDVINVSDQIEKLETSYIQVAPDQSENFILRYTLSLITQLPVSVHDQVEPKYRAKVVVVLGEDYWNYLYSKPTKNN